MPTSPTFPSTHLAQSNDPQEIQKGQLDLLAKINSLAGPSGTNSIAISANLSLLSTQYQYVYCTAGASGLTIQLPTSTAFKFSTFYAAKVDSGAGSVTITSNGNDLINGASNIVVPHQYSAIILAPISGGWDIISSTFRLPDAAAPLPTASAGAGHVTYLSPALGAAAVLPAGGTWDWMNEGFTAAGAWIGPGDVYRTVSAGGVTIGAATVGTYWRAFIYEIQDSSDMDFSKPIFLLPDLDPFGQPMYAVTKINGYPYGVISTDPLWEQIQLWIAAGNTPQTYVPPAPIPPDPVQVANQTLQQLSQKFWNQFVVGPNVISSGLSPADVAAYKAAWKAAGN